MGSLDFLWAEVTGKCQLECVHCYADSGPLGTHGVMEIADWMSVIDDATTLGVRMVQFIGGEPTLYPHLPELMDRALGRGVAVEVFSNLVHVTAAMWAAFSRPGVHLATSYYSDAPDQHESVTRRRNSHRRSAANIAEAVARSIPLRVGLIDVFPGQRVTDARAELAALGVTAIDEDRLRQVGRGARSGLPNAAELCGGCARGKVAVSGNGDVWPCVFARWSPMGNVLRTPLAGIVTPDSMKRARQRVGTEIVGEKCDPQSRCDPSQSNCQPHCPPGYHSHPKRCWPYYYDNRR